MRNCAPLFLQPGLTSVIVLDSDIEGRRLEETFRGELGLPNEYIKDIIMIAHEGIVADNLSDSDHELEDLFGVEYYTSLVNDTVPADNILSPSDFESDSRIGKQAQQLLKTRQGVDLRKDMGAWAFRKRVLDGDHEIPVDAREAFLNLLSRVSKSFAS